MSRRSSFTRRIEATAALLGIAVAASAAGAPDLAGQASEEAPAGEAEARTWCFLAKPAPSCRAYPILEVQAMTGIASTTLTRPIGPSRPAFDEWNLEFNLGHVFNLSPRWSVGGLVTLGSNSGGFDGARGRLRYWISPDFSLEADAGVIRTNLGSYAPVSTGPSLAVRANVFDVTFIAVRYDRVAVPATRETPSSTQSGLSAGIGAMGPTAIVASGLIGLGVGVLILLLAGSMS